MAPSERFPREENPWPARLRSLRLENRALSTFVDSTFHVLPRNPDGDTFHKESRGS